MTLKREQTRNDLRCFCERRPLLATYGIDTEGKIYIHIRIWKQQRIFGEILITGGVVKIHCRECKRWHTVTIRDETEARLKVIKTPLPLANGVGRDQSLTNPTPTR